MPRRRRIGLFVLLGIVVLVLLFTGLAGFWIDILWYREVDLSQVFWTTLRTRGSLTLTFGLVFFGALYANLLIVRRLKPPFRALTAEQQIIERYRVQVAPSLRWILPLICRRGHVTKSEIGAIRIGAGETRFQVPRALADRFAKAAAKSATQDEDGVLIELADGPPPPGTRGDHQPDDHRPNDHRPRHHKPRNHDRPVHRARPAKAHRGKPPRNKG